jgi:hypothetical protein
VRPQLDAGSAVHSLSGSRPTRIAPHTPSAPVPFFAAVQAWQVPVQSELQQTPSTQKPEVQSEPVLQVAPAAQRVAQIAVSPPQSTEVSVTSFVPLLQSSVPPQPFEGVPQVAPIAPQLGTGVQPQMPGEPPPPQVCGEVQSALVAQPQWPEMHW